MLSWPVTRGMATKCNNKGVEVRVVKTTVSTTEYQCRHYKPAQYAEKPRCMFYRPETEMCDYLERKE
jgi:hypothetical protein